MQQRIKTFDIFTKALENLETEDSALYQWERNRLALTGALAKQIEKLCTQKNPKIRADICPVLTRSKKVLNPDIIVHERNTEKALLCIACRNDYLAEDEQQALKELSKTIKCELVMAVSFFPQKNYMLVYRATDNGIEYYHFDRNTLTIKTIRIKALQTKPNAEDKMLF